ncbi:SMI1/KNR4 family protein [Paenibacillus sp. GCM10027627]|uniref:SMI1/KNR4 family protein n=1 Tax=unclassified Paenibacillus TaxID=185978 RepID=UPI00362ED487
MANLPDGLEEVLEEEIYVRKNKGEVQNAISRLGVTVSGTFFEFYSKYEGPFWEEYVSFELLDIVVDIHTIESCTMISRQEHGFPEQYLVLSEMSANAVLVLDTYTDRVYKVDFEGGDEMLKKGELKETWPTFFDFLVEYFNCLD